jgi:hypothetical protein
MYCMQTYSVVSCLLLPYFFLCFFLVLISFILLFVDAAVYCCTWSHSVTHTHKLSPSQKPLNDKTQQTNISPAGFELAIPASERAQSHASDRAARFLSLHHEYKFIFGILQLFLIIVSCPEYNFVLTKSQTFQYIPAVAQFLLKNSLLPAYVYRHSLTAGAADDTVSMPEIMRSQQPQTCCQVLRRAEEAFSSCRSGFAFQSVSLR